MLGTLLLVSAGVGVIVIGLVYLTRLEWVLSQTGRSNIVKTATLKNVLRSNYGGTFPAFGVLFLFGAFVPELKFTALVCLLVFMAGFAVGRIVSIVVDGKPSPFLLLITATEVLYSALCIYLLM